MRRTALFKLVVPLAFACGLHGATVLVLPFNNDSQYSDLNWVGASVADTLMNEFAGANEIVFNRAERAEGMRRLSLRPGANFTKATLIRLGQTLDADYVCYGGFDLTLPSPGAPLKDSSIRITAQFIDLRKMHDGPELSEAGKLTELSRFEEHLAYQSIKYLRPNENIEVDRFLSPQKLVRLEAEESYVRGLLSSNREQKQKWFLQATAVDSKFAEPAFELGKLALEQKQYAQALEWLRRIPPSDPNYIEAKFKIGLAAYGAGDYNSSAANFRDVVKAYPLSEVYNDLGAAEDQLNQPGAKDDFRHALESDPHNTTYLFNLALTLYKTASYDDAAKYLQQLLEREGNDTEARALLDHSRRHEALAAGAKLPPDRLKTSFNETAFRQLKAVLQVKQGKPVR